MIYTTLRKIKEHRPCISGWTALLRHLNKTRADDEPLALEVILEANGLDDALWCLRAVDGYDREKRLFAVACARRVQHLMLDQRSIAAIDVAERYAKGQASDEELAAARAAAWAAEDAPTTAWVTARDAAQAVWDVSWTVRVAVESAAETARAAAAQAAARTASGAAARAVAWNATRADEVIWQTADFRLIFLD